MRHRYALTLQFLCSSVQCGNATQLRRSMNGPLSNTAWRCNGGGGHSNINNLGMLVKSKQKLSEVNWCEISDGNNADDDSNKFLVTFDDLYNECIPLKICRTEKRTNRRVYTAVYLSKGNTFQKLTGKNGHVDTLVGYNFQKEKSLPASFKPQEILWLMLTFWKLDPV